jgi:hypothetical protein
MKFKILKAFHYGPDGINTKHLKEGDEHEIDDGLKEGLLKEKFITTTIASKK